jgi:hypothetical protein
VGSFSILPIGTYAASANFHQPRDTTLDGSDSDCVQNFTSYLATHGPDPLASFHLSRLLAGQVGSTIHLAEE